MLLGKFRISGHSMAPILKEGETVLISSIPYLILKPKIGDAVAFKYFNIILIKRIKKVKSKHYLMEGDNLSDSLKIGWINKSDIIGSVIYKL